MSQGMSRPRIDPSNPASVAGDVLSRISSYDSTAPVPTVDVIRDWAEMIRAARIDHQWLIEGIARVYMGGGDPPRNKLGAIIAAAKQARSQATQGQALRELAKGPSFDDGGNRTTPLIDAYQVDDAIGLACPTCKATPGEFCGPHDAPSIIPHTSRLGVAYRQNNPRGRAEHAARQQHLANYRKQQAAKKPPRP